MKRLIILMLLIFTCCAASRIEIDRAAVKQVRSIAIAPFTSDAGLDVNILQGAMEYFRQAFTLCGFSVVEQRKTDELLAETEFNSAGINGDRVSGAFRALGADAILTGNITLHEEVTRIAANHWNSGFGMLLPFDKHEKTAWRTYLKFSITVELINASDGNVILKMTNRYTETEKDEELPGFHDINAYRNYVLKKMSGELVAEISKKDRQFNEQPGVSRSSE